MANTIVLSAEQQIPFRAHNIAKDEPNSIEQSRRAVDSQDDEGKVNVTLPDMFALFLSGPPRVNPNYARVKAESEVWFVEYIHPYHYKPKVYILIITHSVTLQKMPTGCSLEKNPRKNRFLVFLCNHGGGCRATGVENSL
jgi:hypothetical protein